MDILMVCLGNICRSPMMEGWLADALARQPGLAGRVRVDSAAIGPWHVGRPPDPRAIAVAARHGVDISGQRARRLVPADFVNFDLVLFADADTLRDGLELARAADVDEVKIGRYLEWAGVPGDADLADPYYGDAAGFQRAWERVAEGGEAIIARLLAGSGA